MPAAGAVCILETTIVDKGLGTISGQTAACLYQELAVRQLDGQWLVSKDFPGFDFLT